MMDSPTESWTYDEALTKRIGQFGFGQWRLLAWASLPQFANAAAFFLWVFITINPIATGDWECTSNVDVACQAVWQQDPPSSQAFCSLHPEQWRWTNQGVSATGASAHMPVSIKHHTGLILASNPCSSCSPTKVSQCPACRLPGGQVQPGLC